MRQLDYWAETDLIVPSVNKASGQGTRKRYSEQDLDDIRKVLRLLALDYSTRAIRKAINNLKTLTQGKFTIGDAQFSSIGDTILAHYWDGESLVTIDVLRRPGQYLWGFPVVVGAGSGIEL